MPAITSREIGVALDMHGCPNRCRHCGVGARPNPCLTHDDLRWAAAQFRSYVKPGENRPFIEKLSVMSWTREPDFSDDYRELAQLEAELGDGKPTRFELLSIWRLARDAGYAEWVKEVGPDICQITFFGLQETQDWFCQRPGAFEDSILATERLLAVGVKPRWQLFLTKRILPDLAGLMRLVESMRLREQVKSLGSEFDIFIHPPGFIGEGRNIVDLCATLGDTKLVPVHLVEATQKHFKKEEIWITEEETVERILSDSSGSRVPVDNRPEKLWFEVEGNWDVFTNMGNPEPWWKLGNLKTDPISLVFDRFENDIPMAYQLNRPETLPILARRYGNPTSQRVVNDIEQYWFDSYCAEQWHRRSPAEPTSR